VLDTSFYRYNASAAVSLTGSATGDDTADWTLLLPRTSLQPDTIHDLQAKPAPPVRFVRVDAFPDGGISRIRIIGRVDPLQRAEAGRRWWNALPDRHAVEVLANTGVPAATADGLAADRPIAIGSLAPEPLRVLLDGPDATP
jgi:allantoicase